LGVEEREAIALGLARGEPLAEIARRMRRPTSTVSREVARCGGRDGYSGRAAQRLCCERARRPKTRKLVADPVLAGVVADGPGKRWSPAEISARLVLDHPDDGAMRVSAETIYTSLYLQGRGGLRKELISALRSGRLRRRPARGARTPSGATCWATSSRSRLGRPRPLTGGCRATGREI
jgi:IS30 family transposase